MKECWKKFEEYYNQHVGPVYRYIALRVKTKAEAEDLTSEIFMKALEHFEDFIEERPFSPWIFTIAHNHLISYFQKNHPTIDLEEIAELRNPYDLEDAVSDHLDFEKLKEAMAEMDPDKQQMIEMKYILGYTYKEIGEIMGKTEENVKVATFRAMEELRKKVNIPRELSEQMETSSFPQTP